MPLNTLRDRSMSEATRTLPPFWTAGRVASMAARPAPNGDICEWEAEGVLILMTAGRAVLRASDEPEVRVRPCRWPGIRFGAGRAEAR